MTSKRCLLCGDPQQPSEYMYESAGFLEDHGVEFSRMEWRGDVSAERFREITMEMEDRGPNDYDTDDIIDRIEGIEILVIHKAPVSAELIEAADDLEVIGCARGGYENVDVEAAKANDVTVLHAPGRNRNAVADYAVGLILAKVRDIPRFARTTARGEWQLEFDPEQLPRDMDALTIGVVGFGNIGRGVTTRVQGFGPTVVAYDPYVDDDAISEFGADPVELTELLATADVVTLHVRLSDETRHLIGADEFAAMKESASLVNTARGGLIDEDALVEALETGSIAGAALDVFEEEPLPDDHPLLDLENAILTPHTAGSTKDAVLNGSKIIAEQLANLLDGEEPAHVVV